MGLFKRKSKQEEETPKPKKEKKSKYKELATPPFPIEALTEKQFLINLKQKINQRLEQL